MLVYLQLYMVTLFILGWRPRRSIVFCSWDGEEYGIIGSIEWLDVSFVIKVSAVNPCIAQSCRMSNTSKMDVTISQILNWFFLF